MAKKKFLLPEELFYDADPYLVAGLAGTDHAIVTLKDRNSQAGGMTTLPLDSFEGVPKPLEEAVASGTERVLAKLKAAGGDPAAMDVKLLADVWCHLELWPLPEEFDWRRLCRRYQNKARAILRDADDLRPLLDSQNLDESVAAVRRMAPMDPGFDLVRYAEAMRERYARLPLEALDVTGSYYRELELWRVDERAFVRRHSRN